MFELIIQGLLNVLTPVNLIVLIIAVTLGLLGGAIPGISGTMLVVVLLPLTYSMDPAPAFILLTAVYVVVSFSGSISAILFRTPGAPEAVATVFDGYPMAQKGKAGDALGTALLASTTGGVIGAIFLMTLTPLLSSIALQFAAPEYFALAAMGLAVVASLSGNDTVKGFIGVLFGLFIATIGTDALSGTQRYTFGSSDLATGVELIPIIIGLFAIAEFLSKANEQQEFKKKVEAVKVKIFNTKIFKNIYKTMARSSILGVFIGVLPGIGATTAAMLSYSEEVRSSKEPETYGKGNPRGIAAAETANNAAAMGTLVPLLSLGIPGGATAAVLLGAFILHGMQPGPTLFANNPELMYTIFGGLLLANIVMFFLAKPFIKVFQRIINIPYYVLGPLIVMFCLIGTYSVRNSMFDVGVMFVFGILGYVLEKADFPLATVILGVVLGPIAEDQFRRSLELSGGDFSVFFTRPISAILLAIAIIMLVAPFVTNFIKKRKQEKAKLSNETSN